MNHGDWAHVISPWVQSPGGSHRLLASGTNGEPMKAAWIPHSCPIFTGENDDWPTDPMERLWKLWTTKTTRMINPLFVNFFQGFHCICLVRFRETHRIWHQRQEPRTTRNAELSFVASKMESSGTAIIDTPDPKLHLFVIEATISWGYPPCWKVLMSGCFGFQVANCATLE